VTVESGERRPWPLPVFGLAGSIASGKTTLARELERLGAVVMDADRVGHSVLRRGNPAWRRVRAQFGRAVAPADGPVDRARLGAVVFGDAAARRRLEGILHPAIESALRARVRRVARDGFAIVVIEAALLPESGLDLALDGLAVVVSSRAAQIERLARDRGMDRAEARRRIAAQWAAGRKAARATWVVPNDGSPSDLARAASRLWSAMRSHPASLAAWRRAGAARRPR